MKSIKNILAVLAFGILMSCHNDDVLSDVTGTGNLSVEFDNAYGSNDLVLGNVNNANSSGESLKISSAKYIVSNVVLVDENGNTFTYPKESGYFITDEADESKLFLELHNVPAANYTHVRFGIGVDQAQWSLGEASQGEFLEMATSAGLFPATGGGYKFFSCQGMFTSGSVTTETPFVIETGQTSDQYNYTEVSLDLPQKALVRTTITPEIHIVADLSKILDGPAKIQLSSHVSDGSAAITTGADIVTITSNISSMFSVAHVHND